MRSLFNGRHARHRTCLHGLSSLLLLFWLGTVVSAEAQSPASLPYPSTGRYVGTVQDSVDGQLSTDQSMSFTSATQFEVPPNTTGTYTYAKTGANTATMTYQAHTVVGEYQQHENTTALLVFSSPTTGTYTSSGSYTGSYFGVPFGGTLSNGTGTFNFKVLPTVTTPTHTAVQTTSATLGGTVANDGAGTISGRGVVYCLQSVSSTPVVGDDGMTAVTTTGTLGAFTVSATGLTPGETYAYRAFATNEVGRGYSTTGTFTTGATAPAISLPTATSVTDRSALLGGSAAAHGSPITEYGVVYAKTGMNNDPVIGGAGVTKATITSDSFTSFKVAVGPLLPTHQYSYKAYAINALGTTYTSVATFVTQNGRPEVTTPTAINILSTSATLGGLVESWGGSTLELGVVLARTSINPTPAINGAGVTKLTGFTGTIGPFSIPFSGLLPATDYCFRAYATNNLGTNYTTPVSTFTTQHQLPAITTPTSASITNSTAVLGANVTSEGSLPLTARGVLCAPTAVNATPDFGGTGVLHFPAGGTPGTGVFTASATGLAPNTPYSFRAYATSGAGTVYTTPVSAFTTPPGPPTLTTTSVRNVTSTGAIVGGTVTSDNGAALTERGIVWAVTSTNSNPIIGGPGVTKRTSSGAVGTLSEVTLSGLANGTSHTFKAYATNSAGTSYTSPATTFTTVGLPSITAATATNLTYNGVVVGATVTSDGGDASVSYGVVNSLASVNSDPVIGGPGVGLSGYSNRTTGTFTMGISLPAAGSQYALKMYVTNSVGTAYTPVFFLTTLTTVPGITTPTSGGITGTTAALGGNVTDTGAGAGTTVTRGVVYARTTVNDTPAQGGTGVVDVPAGSGGTGPFTVNASGLTPGTAYSYRAYASNADGTTYTSPATTFNTPSLPTITSPTATSVNLTTVTLGGNITSTGGASITESGVVYAVSTGNSDPFMNGPGVIKVLEDNPDFGSFTKGVTGLQPGTTYSFRAYATNVVGTAHTSLAGTFTTLGLPVVSAPTVTGITSSTATLGGAATYHAPYSITERGVVWSITATNSNPVIGGTGVTRVIFPTGSSRQVTGLTPGTAHTFKFYAVNSLGVAYTEPATTFTTLTQTENWRKTHFGAADNTGSAADAADPDKDGLANLLEYAFGLTPTTGDSRLMPQPQHNGVSFSITFTQPAGVSGVTYGAQWSTTLQPGSWTNISDTGVGMTHLFSVPVSNGPKVFIQLKVTAP